MSSTAVNSRFAAVLHVEGTKPLIDSLSASVIYHELRVRMKDHVGQMHGTAEAVWKQKKWNHLVITWDKKRVRQYVNGKEESRGPMSPASVGSKPGDEIIHLPTGQQTKINLGWRYGNWPGDCRIDEITIHGKALTLEDVKARYAGK